MLVVPDLPYNLIFGVDVWIQMGIVPDLYSGQWSFTTGHQHSLLVISAIQYLEHLTDPQRKDVQN